MRKFILIISFFIALNCFSQKEIVAVLVIDWEDSISGDFSFKDSWSYHENIFKNSFGQLVCDGNCPIRTYKMKDSLDRIYDDSLAAYYQLIDTTHQYHTLSCEANCYEWVGSNLIRVERKKHELVICQTQMNVGTHTILTIRIDGNFSSHNLTLNSYRADIGKKVFEGSNGHLKIDKNLWKTGIMKADFEFEFYTDNPKMPLFWRGKIYSKIVQ